jgi:hypothetical protein
VYQEAREVGLKKGIILAIAKMAAKKKSAAEIAAILELDEEQVRQKMAAAGSK